MEVKKEVTVGKDKSNDILITISEGNGINIELESPVKKRFGKEILNVIETTVKRLGLENASIKAKDNGALNFAIKARVEAAVLKACEVTQIDWSKFDD